MASNLNILSLNVNGLRNITKRKVLFKKFKEYKYDVICLQETYITEEIVDQWKREWGGEFVYSVGTNRSKGQVILFRKNLPFNFTVLYSSDRIIVVNLDTNSSSYCIVNAYAPSTTNSTHDFLNNLTGVINDVDFLNLIVCGDFNSVLSNDLDIISGDLHSDLSVQNFVNFNHMNDLTDSFRLFNPDRKEYSWSRMIKGALIARRLDYILINDSVVNDALECNLTSFPQSDHRGVYMKIQEKTLVRGAGYWKMNNALLNEIRYLEKINSVIDEFVSDEENVDLEPDIKWELLKIRIKEETINYSKIRAVNKRNDLCKIQNDLDRVENLLASKPQDTELLKDRNRLLVKLELLEQEKSKSAQVRSKSRWIEEGDKNTNFFLNLEKARNNSKLMTKLELDDQTTITDQQEILNAQTAYFKNLYKLDQNSNIENLQEHLDIFMGDSNIPNLSEREKIICEGRISLEELGVALKGLNQNSSPGLDGLSTEFYKVFWGKLGPLLEESFNASFNKGTLTFSQSSAVITLIHKGKDLSKDKLTNWRPISLTNSDYKILAKSLALRLLNVIDSIVSKDQSSYIPGRDISNNIRIIDDIVEYLRLKNKPGLLLAIDFSKAFDSISRKFMKTAFQKFGFGEDFIRWVDILLNNTRSKIIYNGWISEAFMVERGIRQGCPFSPLAFIIGIEYLAIKIRSNQRIKGVILESANSDNINVIKTLLYADDVTLFLKDTQDLEIVLEILEQFKYISGLHINKRKTEAMWLGSNLQRGCYGFNLKWVNEVKILGIFFSNARVASEIEKNWNEQINKCRQIINQWEKRNLSILGKVCVIKTFLSSQFTFIMRSIVIPDKVLSEINTLFFRFLWRRRDCNRRAFEKVKRKIMISDFSEGGVKMIDVKILQTSFQLEWLVRVSKSNSTDKWAWIPSLYFAKFGRNMAFLNTTVGLKNFKGLNLVLGNFWNLILKTWLLNNTVRSIENSRWECIWENNHILYQSKVILFENWTKKGITYINDILDNNGIKSFDEIEMIIGRSASLRFEYNVVFNAVSRFLRQYPPTDLEADHVRVLFNDNRCTIAKMFKIYLTERNYCTPTSVRFWYNKFNIEIDQLYWELAVITTKESRLREIHWKILSNIYPTNFLKLVFQQTLDVSSVLMKLIILIISFSLV